MHRIKAGQNRVCRVAVFSLVRFLRAAAHDAENPVKYQELQHKRKNQTTNRASHAASKTQNVMQIPVTPERQVHTAKMRMLEAADGAARVLQQQRQLLLDNSPHG